MRIAISFLLLSGFSLIQAFTQKSDLDRIIATESRAFSSHQMQFKTNTVENCDIIYHRCEWFVDPAIREITGKVTTHFVPDAAINFVEFDLADTLTVDSVKYHGTSLTFSHTANEVLHLNFPGLISAGQIDSVSIWYHGPPGNTGFGSFIQSTHGVNADPVVWTLSEPYGSRDWWPCKQSLNDKADSMDIFITAPIANRAASNGVLISETVNGPNRTAHWRHTFPITPYLVCLAVTNYVTYTDIVPEVPNPITVLNYVYQEDSVNASIGTLAIADFMQLFDSLFGLYPFASEKYGHAQFGWGGGMEHQTMTFVGSWGGELLNHELAHHWFGDMVTCGSWQDIWLNEGFATYCSSLCYEFLDPVWLVPNRNGHIASITSAPDGSVFCTDTTQVSRIFSGRLSYAKGMMLLTTLRWVIGDSAFFQGIRNYLIDPAVRYGFARTSDFIAHLEASSGQNLAWYFNDWFTGEGFPSYSFNWVQDANQLLTFTVDQTQSHSSVSFFELPLPIRFKNNFMGQDTLIRFDHTTNPQTFAVTIPFHVDSLLFDPMKVIISNFNSVISRSKPIDERNGPFLFPNPATTTISLRTNIKLDAGELCSVSGTVIRQLGADELNAKVISIADLASGAYLIRVRIGSEYYSERFVKE
jgi:aminopeptidase N